MIRRVSVRSIVGLVVAFGIVYSAFAQSAPVYRVTHTYMLGGDGGWDYVVPDPPEHRVFIGRQNRVMVVDADNGKLLGEVTGINGAHGTAIATGTGHGFATSGNDQSVVMFDLKTFKALGRIPAAEDADAIIYDPASNRVFTFNGDAHSSTVIDPVAGKLITNIPLGGKPEYGASAGDGKVYANLTDTSEVVEIDAKTATVTRRWPTAPCKQNVSMAIDAAHHRLFSGCPQRRAGGVRLPGRQGCRDGARSAWASTAPATIPPPATSSRRMRTGRSPSSIRTVPTSITSSRPCRRRWVPGTWDSIPRRIACTWFRDSSARRRRAGADVEPCCRERSR